MRFWAITKEANGFGIRVTWNAFTSMYDFVDVRTGLARSWMTKYGKEWRGYNGKETVRGQKGKVANKCLDWAANYE